MAPTPNKYHLLKVVALREVQAGVVVTFSDGAAALLRRADGGDGAVLRFLQLAQSGQILVSVWVNEEGQIGDVAGVERDTVFGVEDNSAMPGAVAVWFGKMDGRVGLMKDHPKFREIVTALNEAAASNQPIWYITRSGCLLDVIPPGPEEDTSLARLLDSKPPLPRVPTCRQASVASLDKGICSGAPGEDERSA